MINSAPAITDRYIASQFVNLQYRQELHDRLYFNSPPQEGKWKLGNH